MGKPVVLWTDIYGVESQLPKRIIYHNLDNFLTTTPH